jgi:uncharacterized repeat protein (TIGR03803 family)
LYSFTGGADGSHPFGGLLRDAGRNLYGITYAGGNYGSACADGGCGTVFKLDPNGTETVLYSFRGGAEGTFPQSELFRDSAGNLYGTTAYGGIQGCGGNGCGTVFKLDSSGNFTLLHSFTGKADDGATPEYGPLIRAGGGNLYGTTLKGGPYDQGTVFKLDSNGNLTVLHSFSGGVDGGQPIPGVIRTAAGALFGTTNAGGTHTLGVVFKLDTTGKLIVLHNFSRVSGEYPLGRLVRDGDNNLYGTTMSGGAYGHGTAFKLSPP